MQDRYLFKAKRKDNGEWVEGFICKKKYKSNKFYISCFPDKDDNKQFFAIDPDTICQSTGIKVKNDNLIWENDILKNLLTGETAPIRYGSYKSCFNSEKTEHVGFYVNWSGTYSKNYRKDLGYWIHAFGVEIIGNVFDNPELLEE